MQPSANRFYSFNAYLKSIFGCRVHKIPLDAGFNCPNRDGTLSRAGCIYCNPKGSGTGAFAKGISITDQLNMSKQKVIKRFKAKKFIAYFQAFTNTYAPVEKLEAIYSEALRVEDVVGLDIGTRPDCIDEPTLQLLEGYAQSHLVWLEYGLQSAHDKTLMQINRGHDYQTFVKAVKATEHRNINICAHIILGLPGENRQDMLETVKAMTDLNIDGIKIHLLYVIQGTTLHAMHASGAYRCLEQPAYVDLVCDIIELLPAHMVIMRLTSDPHPYELVAPQWARNKKQTLDMIHQSLIDRDAYQGRQYASRV
jgi:radical SAM protein (TIGR01212 family)